MELTQISIKIQKKPSKKSKNLINLDQDENLMIKRSTNNKMKRHQKKKS